MQPCVLGAGENVEAGTLRRFCRFLSPSGILSGGIRLAERIAKCVGVFPFPIVDDPAETPHPESLRANLTGFRGASTRRRTQPRASLEALCPRSIPTCIRHLVLARAIPVEEIRVFP